MKKYLFFATALVALASCSSNDYIGEQPPVSSQTEPGAIVFGTGVNAITRADKTGSDAASDLNNKFFVYGIKDESSDHAGNVATGHLVFKNYRVDWTDNSAYKTTSNTKNWEYVGNTLTEKERTKVTDNSGAGAQTIKYWDYGAKDYTFYAFSALPADIEGDKVSVAKVQTANTVYNNGYTVTLAEGADLDHLFFSERKFIERSNSSDRTATNTYGGNVTFRFHNMAAKVRVAMYETIPGYSVTINKFSVINSDAPTFATMTTDKTDAFNANLINNAKGTAGTMNVTYVASGATENHPSVAFTPTSNAANILTLGGNLKANVTIGETVAGATYDKSDKAYTSMIPNETNDKNLKLKLSYTLTAPETGETIIVTDATAEIPSNYLKWKPGYAYTYIFKISDNTNGYTGGSSSYPAGLYPITFDAVEAIAEDGQAEYITTVSEPSITTFGVNSSTGKYVYGGNEYAAGSDIYATIVQTSTVQDPTSKYAVYTVTGSGISEAAVAEAIAEKAIGRVTTPALTCTAYTTNVSVVTSVPGEDGVNKTVTGAIKMQAPIAATYAVEFKASDGSATAETAPYDATKTYYSMTADSKGFYRLLPPSGEEIENWEANKSKYTTAPTQPVYVYKVIIVESAP